jgi:NAD(P)-dependent dehydrogenase (short-subunit alcohol dehydrogenase family)
VQDVRGKIAVVTGGGSGIGRSMALAFADAGMHVAVADVEDAAAQAVCKEIAARGVRGLAVRTDVADPAAVDALADRVWRDLGGCHLLCNNAGVFVSGPLDTMTAADWRWVLSVNVEGVVNGLLAFVPRMRDAKREAHVVNTASMAGQIGAPGLGVYCATKFAVVGLSESLRADLAPHGIGVSVLCPAFVKTRIAQATRNRPVPLGGPRGGPDPLAAFVDAGIDVAPVGRAVLDAVLANDFWIFTHPEAREWVEQRLQGILEAFDGVPARMERARR